MTASDFPRHHSSEAHVAAAPEVLFDALDDHRRLAGHMERPSLMNLGGSMHIKTDANLVRGGYDYCFNAGTNLRPLDTIECDSTLDGNYTVPFEPQGNTTSRTSEWQIEAVVP
jgi:hypothetical protein